MRTRERVSAVAACAAIAVAVLCVGSAFRWVEAIVATLVGIAIVPQILSRRTFSRIPPLVVLFGAAAVLCAIQLVPLPAMLVRSLQPVGDALREEGATLAGTEPWQALTLDAPATLRGVCFFVILAGVAWLALRMTVTSSGRYRVLAALAAVCGAAALVTGVHELLGMDELYGVYEPRMGFRPVVLGPLLNANHLGCLMAVGAMAGLGLVMYPRQRTWVRVVWIGQLTACATVAVASQSRGATLALITGVLVTGAVLVAQRLFGTERKSRPGFLTTSLPVGVVAISTIVVIVYASAGGVSAELSRTNLEAEVQNTHSKFAIWRAARELIEESPWVGVGRGAFEPAVTHTHPAAAFASFSHVENEYIQAVVDWGVIGGAALAGILAWIVVAGFRRWRDGPITAGAIGGIAVIALQSTVDFGVQLLGLAIPLAMLLAIVTYVPLREETGQRKQLALGLRAAQLIGLALAAVLLVLPVTTTVAEDHEALAQKDVKLDEVRDAIERHPLDYYGFAVAAQVMFRENDARAVSLLNHALRLHPTHPGLHHIAARVLYQSGRPEQAAIEYAQALRGTKNVEPMLAEIVKRLPSKHAAAAIPTDMQDFDVVVRALVDLSKSTELATLWLSRVLDVRPNDTRACDWLYSLSIRDKDIRAAEKASAKCTEHSLDNESKVSLARMLMSKERFAEAKHLVEDVETWQGRNDLRLQAWLLVCDVEIAQAHWDVAKRCLRRLDVSGLAQGDARAQVTTRLDQIEEKLREIPK